MKVLLKILKKKHQTGFSLIELMIVVVIIGILSTIAIPQYQNFQKKAKQSEAKANLGGLYTTMKTFQAEWNQYYGDFRALGFDVGGTLNYGVGFQASHAVGPAAHPSKLFKNAASKQHNTLIHCAVPNSGCTMGPQAKAPIGTSMSAPAAAVQTFVAGANGNIDTDVTLDTWTINQLKVFQHVNDDVSN